MIESVLITVQPHEHANLNSERQLEVRLGIEPGTRGKPPSRRHPNGRAPTPPRFDPQGMDFVDVDVPSTEIDRELKSIAYERAIDRLQDGPRAFVV